MGRDKEFTRKLNSLSKVRGQFLKNNYEEFLEILEKVKEDLKNKNKPSLTINAELDRRFYNYINCYYQLEELEKKILNLISKSRKSEIKERKDEILDEERKYFIKGLRGYYTHKNTGDLQFLKEKDKTANLVLSINNDLLEDFKENDFSKSISYLDRFDENIPIESEVKKFHNSVLLYYDWLQHELRTHS